MMQLLRHLDAVARNAPAPGIAAVRAVAQRALDRAGRTGADADDLAHWRTQARTLGL
jgi:hypothetical protein